MILVWQTRKFNKLGRNEKVLTKVLQQRNEVLNVVIMRQLSRNETRKFKQSDQYS
jgi:hypothetical protein